jgi:hypothetical protein
MKVGLFFGLLLLTFSTVFAQQTPVDMKGAPDESGIAVLQPEPSDIELAQRQGLKVVKILPRGLMDLEVNEYDLRGGGAYYSFVKASHSYNRTPQIELQQGRFSSGFAGANYGLLKNLGQMDLTVIDEKTPDVAFLLSYTPAKYEPEARAEYDKMRRRGPGISGFMQSVAAAEGAAYLLRGIQYEHGGGDSVVAFNVHRINKDGSMILFWKPIKEFAAPVLLRYKDSEIKAKVDAILKDPKFASVSAEVKDNNILLQGSLVDSEYADLIRRVMQIPSLGLTNQVVKKRD